MIIFNGIMLCFRRKFKAFYACPKAVFMFLAWSSVAEFHFNRIAIKLAALSA